MHPQEEKSDDEKEEYAENISLGMSMHPQEEKIDNEEKKDHHSHDIFPS